MHTPEVDSGRLIESLERMAQIGATKKVGSAALLRPTKIEMLVTYLFHGLRMRTVK